ncbi:DsbE family thiol:disulfide interchange protein [Vibrio tapetis subsp. quintayensis]|uniref:DsbE family thiol:disulfide interchange protein n=1 Tax=Vibrio tapetis TaxID=52443 RepID=UPI0025B49600|nr:DsbE family thiol:disulfide interchange protein [Vibrio tapetis]MDN3679881.1 DsbE family thiol:disulfide interchange protein [Vibrio tapetis subsp. quintayensis]
MSKKVKLSSLFVVLGGFIALLLFGLVSEPDKSNQALMEQAFPTFTLPLLESAEINATEQVFKDSKWTLVNVWASWCVVCAKEHDFLKQLDDRGYFILGLNYRDDIASAAQYLQTHGNPYEVTLFDRDADLALRLGVIGTPETILVDQFGMVRQRHLGELTAMVWQNKFMPIMGAR